MRTPTLQLPAIFSDGMVLQQGMPVAVWGRAPAGAAVTVDVAGASAAATAGPDGSWRLDLPAMPTDRRSHRLTVRAGGESARFDDVKVGEVWLCWGASNMEIPIAECAALGAPAPTEDYPDIRPFRKDG